MILAVARAGGAPKSLLPLVGTPMRAEIQNIVAEIKQSVGLLRRHL
jgi:hypothetical protein